MRWGGPFGADIQFHTGYRMGTIFWYQKKLEAA
jgi:hypothetical protein